METALQIRNAHKRFGGTEALRGADLALRRGERLALLGPNGAGKTTLIRAVAGRVRLDSGEVSLLGSSLTKSDGATRRRLGVAPQEIALYPTLTARENLHAFGELYSGADADLPGRIDAALKWTGLTDRADQPVQTFSGGMKRRLNIAAAVLHEPDVLLLDEPTAGVDPQSRNRIWEMLDELRDRGASLLLTTHQLDEAQRFADRIVIIDHGRTIAAGSLNELVRNTVGQRTRVRLEIENGGSLSHQEHHVDDVAHDLPGLLAAAAANGGRVLDLQVEQPTLQAVFIHLTGRDLRE